MAKRGEKMAGADGACSCCGTLLVHTREPVPLEQLMEEHGITGPQGLDFLKCSEWSDADDVILELVD
jgi:hypothetical protein